MKKLDELKALLEDNASLAVASASLESLQRSIGDYHNFAKTEVDAAKREIGLSRVIKLRQEVSALQDQINQLKAKEQEALNFQRASLLGPSREEAAPTILDIDYFNKEAGILDASGDRIEEFIGLGKTALQDLYEQRSMLKSTRKRLLDAAHTLGLSGSVIRFIEQRTRTDQYILWGGIIVSVCLMALIVTKLEKKFVVEKMQKSVEKLDELLKKLKRSRFSKSSQDIAKRINKQKIIAQEKIKLLAKDYLITNPKKSFKRKILLEILDHLSWVSKETSKNSLKIKTKNVEIRDQGFTKPRVLIITPLKSAAYTIIQDLISMAEGKPEIRFRSRFMEEYSPDSDQEEAKDKPKDYNEIFGGNNDDCFRMGIKFSKKVIGLYANFYSSDLIIGSPLGLRMAATTSKDESNLNFDFLSGIEILLVDKAEVLLMQNWEHMLLIFNHLNLIPKVDHGADFSRIRDWALDGYAKYMRQTIILSKYSTPELNNLMNNHCFNIEGKVKNIQTYDGSILNVTGQVPQVFYRFNPLSIQEDPDSRFKFFIDKIMSNVRQSALLQSHTMIFIPSYFDFTRLRSYFKEEMIPFARLSEYTSNPDISRARGDFFHGSAGFLLMTERFHFYKRYKIRGIKNIIFYGLPMHDHFYSELINLIEDPQDSTIMTIYSRYDKMALERIVGSKNVERMVKGEKESFLYS